MASRRREPLLHAFILLLARLMLIHKISDFMLVPFLKWQFQSGLPNTPRINHDGRAEQGLKVIAAGYCRSATTSLKMALDGLGFQCYHGSNWWSTPGHCRLWMQAARGELDDWQRILRGYTAIVDTPAACFYKELMAAYPSAKVILNVRDPEKWYQSCVRTLYKIHNNLVTRIIERDLYEVSEAIFWAGEFEGRFEDKEFAIRRYERHVEEVKKSVPKEKLLVFEAGKDGWGSLCEFLGVEVPADRPFPQSNDASSLLEGHRKATQFYRLFVAAYMLLISFTLALVGRYFGIGTLKL